ncbi:MAG: NUDIX hydrolase [Nitrospirae bacterium]|nr:NUDIX hydrolase [Nitrospirota bacterium]
MRTERQISSGGVVFRRRNGQIDVVLIAVKEGRVWCLPKGLVEKGENIARTAHREVKEETGLDGKIIKLIDNIHYFYAHKEEGGTTRYFKIVYFFLMEYTGGDVKDHDLEVVDCKWFPIDDAIEMVEYKDEKGLLLKAIEMLKLP